MDILQAVGFSSIFIMPELLVSTHPVVVQSHMDTAGRNFLAAVVDPRTAHEMAEVNCIGIDLEVAAMDGGTGGDEGSVHVTQNNSLASFIIPDSGNLGMSFYSALHRGNDGRKAGSRACAVREPIRGAVGKIFRVQCDLLAFLALHELAWSALLDGVV